MYQQASKGEDAGGAGPGSGAGAGGPSAAADDDVVDADFEEVHEDKK
jgi:hypothetical protein